MTSTSLQTSSQPRTSPRIRALLAAALALLAGILAAAPGRAQTGPPDRMGRQIKVMEGIVDQVLRDSPNFMVMGQDNAHGLYLDEFGAVFTFEASLNDGNGWSGLQSLRNLRNLKFNFHVDKEHGNTVISVPDSNDEDTTAAGDDSLSGADQSRKGMDEARKEMEKARNSMEKARIKARESVVRSGRNREEETDPAVLFKDGKQELIQTLLDYGDTMTTLRDDQSIALAAFLKDSSYFLDNRISRLVLRAKVRDLRDYSAGRITETEMRGRIKESEY